MTRAPVHMGLLLVALGAGCTSGGGVSDRIPIPDAATAPADAPADTTVACKACDARADSPRPRDGAGGKDAPASTGDAGDASNRDSASDARSDATGADDGMVTTHDAGEHDDAEDDATVTDHDSGHEEHDAGHDSGHDAGHDAGHDSGHDAGHDSGHDGGHDAGSGLPGTHLTGQTLAVVTRAGTQTRTYDITVPVTCNAQHLVPLVFIFHGDGGQGSDMYGANFPIEAAAATAKDPAIFVYPNGTNNNLDPDGTPRAWNLYTDPGYRPYTQADPPLPDNDDIDFLDAMIASFETKLCVDKTRIFMTGMSAGGYAANQFARWRSSVIKGTAPQSGGAPFGNPDGDNGPIGSDFAPPNYCIATTNAVNTLIIHGADDTTVDPSNAIQAQGYWEMANSCPGNANNCPNGALGATCATTATTPSPCTIATGCKADVIYCLIPGLGHSIWSNAATTIWSFFAGL